LIKHLLPPDSSHTIEKKNSSTFDFPGYLIIRPNPGKVNGINGVRPFKLSQFEYLKEESKEIIYLKR